MLGFPVILFVLIFVIAIVSIIYGFIAAKRRREEMVLLAARLSLTFYPGGFRSEVHQSVW
jgi:hypothetical protein